VSDAASRIAARFHSRFLQGYVRSKVRTDPVYAAVLDRLRGHRLPLVDVGCGAGVLPLYLREHALSMPITGIDFDERKIAAARKACDGAANVDFIVGDAREPLPAGRSVVMLDLLHYFREGDQRRILENAADAVPPGGMVIIRDAVRDGSWRYRATYLQESFSRLIAWLRAERLHFPTRETIAGAFPGFDAEVVPLWGRTPFNNYLFVFRRPSSGITNA
jgi:SAM-dependent methyltransferase